MEMKESAVKSINVGSISSASFNCRFVSQYFTRKGGFSVERVLANHFLFENLAEDELARVSALAHAKDFANNQLIFSKGDPATGMMAVTTGQVRIVNYSADGKEIVLRLVNPGEVFGEIALIDGGERTAEARAHGKTTLLFIDRHDFLPFLEENPKLCIDLMKVLCQRLRSTSEQLEDFSFLDLRVRLAKCLVHLAGEQGPDGGTGEVTLSISQKMLAAMMGTTREAVNKRLRDWEDQGLLSLGRGAVTVVDPEALAQMVD